MNAVIISRANRLVCNSECVIVLATITGCKRACLCMCTLNCNIESSELGVRLTGVKLLLPAAGAAVSSRLVKAVGLGL